MGIIAVEDYITVSFLNQVIRADPMTRFLHQDIKELLPISRIYKTVYLKMLISIPEDNSHVENTTTEKE